MKTYASAISKKEIPLNQVVTARAVRPSILELIKADHPDFTADSYLSTDELNDYREKYIKTVLIKDMGELTVLEKTVLQKMSDNQTVTDLSDDYDKTESFGARLADKVASFGGSWRFIMIFTGFIFVWIVINMIFLLNKGFDPYPFILLNLILSCIASLQAPVIMMSQNRQETKDRERAKQDYMVNLKSELEIRTLHEKIDHMLINQQQELMEMQKIQIDMLEEILQGMNKRS